jgi:hypothetical protein
MPVASDLEGVGNGVSRVQGRGLTWRHANTAASSSIIACFRCFPNDHGPKSLRAALPWGMQLAFQYRSSECETEVERSLARRHCRFSRGFRCDHEQPQARARVDNEFYSELCRTTFDLRFSIDPRLVRRGVHFAYTNKETQRSLPLHG